MNAMSGRYLNWFFMDTGYTGVLFATIIVELISLNHCPNYISPYDIVISMDLSGIGKLLQIMKMKKVQSMKMIPMQKTFMLHHNVNFFSQG